MHKIVNLPVLVGCFSDPFIGRTRFAFPLTVPIGYEHQKLVTEYGKSAPDFPELVETWKEANRNPVSGQLERNEKLLNGISDEDKRVMGLLNAIADIGFLDWLVSRMNYTSSTR